MSSEFINPAVIEALYLAASRKDAERLSAVVFQGLAQTRKDRSIDEHGNFRHEGVDFTSNPTRSKT